MKKHTDIYYIELYQNECKEIEKCTLKGDYRKGNRIGLKIRSAFKHLETDIPQAIRVFCILLNDTNTVVKTKAAAHCLSLCILQELAIKTLEDVANTETAGIFAFNASMTLRVYKEQGYLKIYPNQRIPRINDG